MMHQPIEYHPSHATRVQDFSLWDRILGLIAHDLEVRRNKKLFVEVEDESDPYRKEIGELCASERQDLPPASREQVAEQLLDRYLAEQGRVDLASKRRAYTRRFEDLAPKDLPALIEADRQRVEAEREEAELAQEVQADLEQLLVAGLAEIGA